jgi:hypothetical protein
MVFNTTFNNIPVISWRSVLLVEETRVPGENHRPVANHRQTLSHIMLYRVHLAWVGFELSTFVVIVDLSVFLRIKCNPHSSRLPIYICTVLINVRLQCTKYYNFASLESSAKWWLGPNSFNNLRSTNGVMPFKLLALL